MNNENKYYYMLLNSRQQKAYDRVRDCAARCAADASLPENIPLDEASAVVSAVCGDYPEYFWMDISARMWHTGGRVSKITLQYNDLAKNLSANRKRFEQAVSAVLSAVKGKTPEEKEKEIHDWLVKNVSYRAGSHDQNAYSALVERRSVCAGYSRAFQLLLTKAGIPCCYCSGEGYSESTKRWEPHAWNILCLHGKYYNTDLTWDDSFDHSAENLISYQYYNCTDADMAKTHRRGKESAGLPKCTASDCSFEKLYHKSWQVSLMEQQGGGRGTAAGTSSAKHTGKGSAGPAGKASAKAAGKGSGRTGKSSAAGSGTAAGAAADASLPMVRSKSDYTKLMLPQLLKKKKGELRTVYGVEGKAAYESLGKWFGELFRDPRLKGHGYQMRIQATDYNNGYYRVEQGSVIQ